MLCPSWTRRSNSASSCLLSQKSEPPATLVVNGLLAAALLFIMDSSITPNVLHQTCYTKRVTPNVLHHKSSNNSNSCKLSYSLWSIAHSSHLLSFPPEHFFPMPPNMLVQCEGRF
jgi:hypothetical protein